jgi:hypothetical protein
MANDFQIRLKIWQQEGWQIQKSKGGHLKLLHKDAKVPVFCASTPSDYRAIMNIEGELKRALGIERPKVSNQETKLSSKPKPVNKQKRFVIWYEENAELSNNNTKSESLFFKTDKKIRCKVWQVVYLRLRFENRELSTIHAIKQRMQRDDDYFSIVLKSFKSSGDEINKLRLLLISRTRQKEQDDKRNFPVFLEKTFRRRRRDGISKNGIRNYL